MSDEKRKLCFVVGPIGLPDSEIRIHADWFLEEIVEPVFSELAEFDVVRADKIASPGMIDAQVIRHLLSADIVVADLSTLNPNAFYEIGIRHMIQKPIIHMQSANESIPFDVSLYRAIRFSRTRPADIRRAREELRAAVRAVTADTYKVDNPITRAQGQIAIELQGTPTQQIIMEQMRAINLRLSALEEKSNAPPKRTKSEICYLTVGLRSALSDKSFLQTHDTIVKIFGARLIGGLSGSDREVQAKLDLAGLDDRTIDSLVKQVEMIRGVTKVDLSTQGG